MRLLLSGIDTSECAYYLRQRSSDGFDFTALSAQREALRVAKRRDPCVVQLGGREFLLGCGGTASGYPLVLSNGEQTIQCGEFNSPSFFVAYRSDALWHRGAANLHSDFCTWSEQVGFIQLKDEGLSRVDFAFDFELPTIDFDEDCFVTQASKDAQHRKDRKVQTFRFGEGDVVLRVYDKSAEIRESSQKTWFYELWGGVQENVWRAEFQVRKAILRRFGTAGARCRDVQSPMIAFNATAPSAFTASNVSSMPFSWAMDLMRSQTGLLRSVSSRS